ncbi:DUF6686 family protein [Labilibaculum sp.]|uniref:DUF6686 family protein n=1 Tax=Labilibaculum sp. TaxID=2060723 RepID=UPI0035694AC0
MIYNRTSNGTLFKCDSCNAIHLEFNNLNINFSNASKYHEYATFLHQLNADEWISVNKDTPYQRKIMIPLGKGNINFMLHAGELEDLKRLCIRRLGSNQIRLQELKIDYSLN